MASSALSADGVAIPPAWVAPTTAPFLAIRDLVVPVVGAGVGHDAGIPKGAELATWVSSRFPLTQTPPNPEHLFNVVDCVDPAHTSAVELRTAVADHIRTFQPTVTDLARRLVHVQSRCLVTFNYDFLLTRAAEAEGKTATVYSRSQLGAAAAAVIRDRWPPTDLVIIHLHGHIDDPAWLVLDGDSYTDLQRDQDFVDLMWELGHHKTLCFVATQLDEQHIVSSLSSHKNGRTHVLCCHQDQRTALTAARMSLSPQRSHVVVEAFAHYSDLITLVDVLGVPPVAEIPASPRIEQSSPVGALYVPNEIIPHSERPADELAPQFLFEPTLASESAQTTERDIASGHRTLVIGAPGSGKTHMLQQIATSMADTAEPIYVRLADLPLGGGSPEIVLERWAMRGHGRQPVSIGAEALRQRSFHFLLDGLDEVAIGSQEDIARLIASLAAALPQHAFTVATRPIPALISTGLSGEGSMWEVVDLAPGLDFRQRYLEARDVPFEALEEAMPGLADVEELLRLPGFLSITVDLFEEGRLSGLQDVGELLAELVALRLEAKGLGELPIPVSAARIWLQRLAVVMQLAGIQRLGVEAARLVPLPLGVVGDSGELAETLVQRLLLAEPAVGTYAFAHRLVGEALCAESLAGLESSETLLDAMAPLVAKDIGGVRADMLIAITLLCARSDRWRAAIAERDPLLAARATPAHAPEAERLAAARRLWQTYEAWQTWMFSYDRPALTNDAAVLGALLRTPGLDRLTDEIHDALSSAHSATSQGNAIRVLGLSHATGLDAEISAILMDPQRDPVVRRQAAIAARDANLVDLVPLIAQRAIEAVDGPEQQDCTLVALRLAQDDQIVDVITLLASSSSSRAIAMETAGRRLTPQQQLHLLRASILGDESGSVFDRRLLRRAAATANADDGEAVRDAVLSALRLNEASDGIQDLVRRNPGAAVAGIVEASREPNVGWWQILPLLHLLPPDTVEHAGLPDPVLDAYRVSCERQRLGSAEVSALPAGPERDPREPPDEGEPWTLRQLLAQADRAGDAAIAHYCQACAGQVDDLSDDERADLRERLEGWWPQGRYRDTIDRPERHSWRQNSRAAAWLWYGPALDVVPTVEQWAELACCGILFEDQTRWLGSHCTTESMLRVAQVCDSSDSETWTQLLSACDTELPSELVECAVARLRETAEPYTLDYLAQRMNRADPAAARRLADVFPEFAEALRPETAVSGDVHAQWELLSRLIDALRSSVPVDGRSLQWLPVAREPSLLPGLFEALRLSYVLPETTGPIWRVDVVTPLIRAIAAIGGPEAVAGYDELIAADAAYRWLREQREAVSQTILVAAGQLAAGKALQAVDLDLPPVDEPPEGASVAD